MGSAARAMRVNTVGETLHSVRAKKSAVGMDLQAPAKPAKFEQETAIDGATEAVTPDTPLLALYDEARVLCRMSQKEMAIDAGTDEGTFSQAMHGARNFPTRWIDNQKPAYKKCLATLQARRWGGTVESHNELLLKDAKASIDTLTRLLERTVVSE